ncbi:glycerophosphodiester phosphodiesterase family protein [Pseudoalteromonas sp. T1lg76]|uniref:glycerophosphodiester phosphodiesterase family protein n=1 Tax=Pseudoalteromonas sp. T1lg76 TaxID=2077103 RepID=UPI000CF63F30|nr:glycerophosphodiester phosphodiesterase family protein [Pseudoalteromonas sp. T1lg76]
MRFALTIIFLASLPQAYAAESTATITSAHTQVQLGPRPYALIDAMTPSALKDTLLACGDKEVKAHSFSIGHRGAPLQFPEHTRESYLAAARMGAGVLECDITFTADKELVCRHSQCDLHTTTNILQTELAAKCSEPFTPAAHGKPASAKCCTSDITLAEFKTLKGKMDGANENAKTVADYLRGTADWRTDLYAHQGTLMTHAQSIALFKELGVQMTPELKAPEVKMPFKGMSQTDYAAKMIEEYRQAQVPPSLVWPQSFNRDDVQYWIDSHPEFAAQTVYLDDRDSDLLFDHRSPRTWSPSMKALADQGIEVIAPPIWMLLDLDQDKKIVPSAYAKAAKTAGLKIIAWSLERSGPLENGGGWYYQSITEAVKHDGVLMQVLDVLAQEVGVIAVFSDWPATTTYYANCLLAPDKKELKQK